MIDVTIFDKLPLAVCWKDADGVYRYINEQFAFFLGEKTDNIINTKLTTGQMKSNNLLQLIKQLDQEILIEQKPVNQTFECQLNDTQQIVMLHGYPTYQNEKITGICYSFQLDCDQESGSFFEQISEEILGVALHKNMDKKTQEIWVMSFLKTILSHMPGYVYWKNRDLVYLGCNDGIVNLTGSKSKTDITGKDDYYFAKLLNWDKAIASFIREVDRRILLGEKSVTSEETLRNDAGKNIILRSSKRPIKDDDGNILGVMGISLDITDIKELEKRLLKEKEKAENANQAKSAFLAMMSHEFRTPLNGIFGIAQKMLQQENLSAIQKKQLETVLVSGKHLISLINDILDFSKLEAGKLSLSFEEFDFRLVIKETSLTLKHLFEDNHLRLITRYSNKIPHMIVADPRRVRQVVINFIGNAVKFTEKGRVTVSVGKAPKSGYIKVSVKDTGIGIPEDKIVTVFDRFAQIDGDKYNRKYGGSGLGLAICKQLIEGMNGEIGLKSKLGKGSTFWFTLPLDLKPTRKTPSQKLNTESDLKYMLQHDAAPLDKPCYLLLIEDNEMNQMVAQLVLDELQCRYDIASSGPEGLALFEKNKYDIICTDIGMPNMNGLEVIERIRAHKKGKKIPILAMTAHVLGEDQDACLEAGADDVLEKPIIFPTLKAMIKRLLK